ncbi:cytochrome b [Thauera linaloolentis]|uniref:Cytochrome B561 n=1 Tax=Thauera linaloolentis (strain DSM 12138 / JCM 21573 / CCUG 41526 / CIP 105981 / IAM 15112 / NBRC 102519 / 47Lol) TaxID=1123367 RepID=N6Y3D0_THAL4|nr:cytochrome b [Thauera linaloolentis]ENO86070.1 cytochrome B561 [Thauera linaloolentis 47Lol = DSM 12138]MCM8565219.1 cytochrome b [Thauera linaloolentis]
MSAQYTATAKALHWGIAVLIFGMLGLGFYMTGLSLSPTKLQLYSWHKWAGVTLFLLVVLRLAWRFAHRPPALPRHMAPIERFAAHAGHHLLYVLMFAIPLTGWLMSSAKGFQTVWFGVVPIPDLLDKDKALGDLLQTVHLSLNFALIAVLLGHVGAALKHHFIDKDDVLTRMLPHRLH